MQNNLDIILQQISKGQILTTEQVDKFLTTVLTSLSAQKKELEKESKDRLSEMKEVMKYIEKEHKDILNEWESKLDTKTTEAYNKVKTGFNVEIEKAKEIIKDLRSIKLQDGYTPVKGVDYFDGKDADETKIVNKVLKKLPKSKDYSAIGIKDMLESLEDDDRLDYGVLKNTPDLSQLANPIMAGAGGRLLSQMNDVDVTGLQNNSLLKWNTERSIWMAGTGGGGSGPELETNGTPNGDQTLLNLEAGTNVTLVDDGLGTVTISATGGGGSGDVVGPASATDNAIARFDTTTGKLIQNSAATIADTTGDITAGTYNGNTIGAGSTSGTNTGDQTTITGNAGTATALQTARTIGTITGDATSAGSSFDGTANNTNALTLATVNSNVGTFGSATQASQVTVNAKGLVTAASNVTVTPAVGSITGLGTGVGTFLATPSSANLATAVTDETGSGALVFATSPTLVTPALGTPSSGTLTNCTGLPVAGITSSTSTALGVGSLELGNASDTTLSRSAAGTLAVEGIRVKTTTPLVVSAASYTTDTGTSLNMDNLDMFIVTAQAGALLFNAPGGTLVQGRSLIIRIKDNGTARALTWNAVFRAMGTALPSTTVVSKTLYLGFFYNATDSKFDLVASAQEA